MFVEMNLMHEPVTGVTESVNVPEVLVTEPLICAVVNDVVVAVAHEARERVVSGFVTRTEDSPCRRGKVFVVRPEAESSQRRAELLNFVRADPRQPVVVRHASSI